MTPQQGEDKMASEELETKKQQTASWDVSDVGGGGGGVDGDVVRWPGSCYSQFLHLLHAHRDAVGLLGDQRPAQTTQAHADVRG